MNATYNVSDFRTSMQLTFCSALTLIRIKRKNENEQKFRKTIIQLILSLLTDSVNVKNPYNIHQSPRR